jgi:7-carboxy-7-deazaguanine synthase
MNLTNITFETNGTQKLHGDLYDYLDTTPIRTTFSISSKLPSSGEAWADAIKPDIVKEYTEVGEAYFKWVVSNQDDYDDVCKAVDEYAAAGVNIPVYLMPAGGTTKHYDENERWVADLAMQNGWRYTPRLQVQLWKNAWGT